jgi:Protein of unknown function (DUF3108)
MIAMCRLILLFLALFLVRPARADDFAPAHLAFSVYAAGLNVLDLQSDVNLGAQAYRVDLSLRTTGLFGALFHSDVKSFVQGDWNLGHPDPLRFASWGIVRGENRRTIIDYRAGQPVVTTLEPPVDEERDPVPPALQRDTVDTLSAMAMLVRTVATTGACDGHVTTFDGHRVLQITAHTAGVETLQSDGRSSFAGPALRCDFDGVQTGGFKHDVSQEELHRIHHSTAWLAHILPGSPALPVRVVFETDYFGHATAYLTAVTPMKASPQSAGASR